MMIRITKCIIPSVVSICSCTSLCRLEEGIIIPNEAGTFSNTRTAYNKVTL